MVPVRISLAEKEQGAGDLAGMPAEEHFRTSDRTFLSYLLKPLQDQFALAFRER